MTRTSIRFHYRTSTRNGRHPGRLYIRVIRSRQSRHIATDYTLYPDEWDARGRRIVYPADMAGGSRAGLPADSTVGLPHERSSADTAGGPDRLRKLSFIDEAMKRDMKRLREIAAALDESGDFSASDVVRLYQASVSRHTLYGYAESNASRLREQGRERTARAYRSAARSLTLFNEGRDILLTEIDAALMRTYEQYLIGGGLKMNTVSFYLRNLRALYFRAVAEGLIVRPPGNPFAGLHTGVYETRRRALDGEQLKALAKLEESLLERLETLAALGSPESGPPDGKRAERNALPGFDIAEPGDCPMGDPSNGECVPSEGSDPISGSGYLAAKRTAEEEYRKTSVLHDSLLYFLFCYHARGMSFVDMAHLRREDVGKESLTYRRRKTGGLLEVKITGPMKRILSHFGGSTKGSDYLFPVIDSRKIDTLRQYETGLKRQNEVLKTLAGMARIGETLSTHVARHTWATLAKRLNVPVAVIGEALGHRDVKTTSIYLASFDRATMDELSVKMSKAAKAA